MEQKKDIYHKSVLVSEVLEYLNPQPHGVYVDATFGGGGHTRAILEHEPTAMVIGFDWDFQAIEMHRQQFEELFPGRIKFIWGNFARIEYLLKKYEGIVSIDGVVADFGTSQYQITQQPGFSFSHDTYLDMRMSPAHQRITAAHIVNSFSFEELRDIFWQYGQERYAKKIAQAIVERRKKKKITHTVDLASLIEKLVPQKQGQRMIHPATRVFQALRIYVNRELDNINAFLTGALKVVRPEGRIVCISFHSLEDRIVKQFFKEHPCIVQKGIKLLTKKVVLATGEEVRDNPSSRSARLRAGQVCEP